MKGHVMQYGPRKGEEIKTLQDVKDYLNWQYENGMITEKNRHDSLIMAKIEFPDEVEHTPSPWGRNPGWGWGSGEIKLGQGEEDIPKVDRHEGAIIRVGDIWVQASPLPDWTLDYIEYPEGMLNQYRNALMREHVKIHKVTDRRIYFTER